MLQLLMSFAFTSVQSFCLNLLYHALNTAAYHPLTCLAVVPMLPHATRCCASPLAAHRHGVTRHRTVFFTIVAHFSLLCNGLPIACHSPPSTVSSGSMLRTVDQHRWPLSVYVKVWARPSRSDLLTLPTLLDFLPGQMGGFRLSYRRKIEIF